MQFIEKNSFNLRSAVYRFKKDGSTLEFLIFPMIHVGSRQFYEEISDRLSHCDLVLTEGVKSKKARILTLSYRVVKRIGRMDLVTQHDGMQVDKFRKKMLHTDLDRRVFDERWGSLPLSLRLQFFVLVPIYVVYLILFGTREVLAQNLALDDLPTSEEILNQNDESDLLDSLIIDARDEELIEQIARVTKERAGRSEKIGILYGAIHMRSVVAFLMQKLNYRVAGAEWVKVFDL